MKDAVALFKLLCPQFYGDWEGPRRSSALRSFDKILNVYGQKVLSLYLPANKAVSQATNRPNSCLREESMERQKKGTQEKTTTKKLIIEEPQ